MPKTIPPTIIYIDREKISLCTSTRLEPTIFKFTSSMIADLEIVNPDELHIGLRQFIEQNKIKPGPIVIIISKMIYFEKNYTGVDSPSQENIDNFISTVPFSATSSKVFKVISGFKQVVINRDFYEKIKQSLEEIGFMVMAVVPGFALGQSANATFTADTCRVIYKKMDQIIVDSIIGASDTKSFQQQEQAILEKNKLPIVLLVLLIFIACGGAIYYFVLRRPPPRRLEEAPIVKILPSPSPEPVVESTASPSAELLKTLTVQILNSSGISGAGSSLSASLRGVGLTNIVVTNSGKITTQTQIKTSELVATTAAEFVESFAVDHYPKATVVPDPEAKFDLVFDLGKTAP